eukprot:CAMPEP_0115443034 /NCGR_PEP_ID=MMETSP0271-20121206/37657_1 /TAXON_ID=71861 /ORGANISM="Scrippsiella trochoidea, Strain CCMP3099" /LENGTH=235 /DNA_ID=CAMNT_0002868891 /DNA_START=82 /DNA_END=786 /DNA_ORIENTATION=-
MTPTGCGGLSPGMLSGAHDSRPTSISPRTYVSPSSPSQPQPPNLSGHCANSTAPCGVPASAGVPKYNPTDWPEVIVTPQRGKNSGIEREPPLSARPPLSDAAALDAALTLALDHSQEQLEALQQERDRYQRKSMDQQVEVLRLTSLLERTEAERSGLLQERRRDHEERSRESRQLECLQQEHREALAEVAVARVEMNETRSSSEEHKSHLERLVTEQRQRLTLLEEAGVAMPLVW